MGLLLLWLTELIIRYCAGSIQLVLIYFRKDMDTQKEMDALDQVIKGDTLEVPRNVTEPFEYLTNQPGKKFRNRLIQEFGQVYKVPQSSIDAVSIFIDELHTASLLIDDIEDDAELRRGMPAAHTKFGTWITLNSAQCAVYMSISKLLEREKNAFISVIINEELIRLHVGQGQDIYWRDNRILPTMEEYYEMAKNKTGGLFRLMIRLLRALSTSAETYPDLISLANASGVLYQIRDDYLNLFSSKMFEQKGFADDLKEGKFSYPLIHAIENSPESGVDNYVFTTLLSRPDTAEKKTELLNYLKQVTKSDAYTKRMISELAEKIITQLIPESMSNIKELVSKLSEVD